MPWPRREDDAEDRAKILGDAADMIFELMCDRATSEQWAEWLRAPLEHAAGTANQDLVEKLLKAGANGSAGRRGCDDNTLLHAAAEGGNEEEVVTALIKAGAEEDIEAKVVGMVRGTPLHVAVATGKEAAARAMMLAGADVNAADRNGDTTLLDLVIGCRGFARDCPIHAAVLVNSWLLGKICCIDETLDQENRSKGGVSWVGAQHPSSITLGHSPDHAYSPNTDRCMERANALSYVLHILGLIPDIQTILSDSLRFCRYTCLYLEHAARQGRHDVVHALAYKGADLDALDDEGMTPISLGTNLSKTALHVAVKCNKAGAIPAFIEAGADIEARTSLGRSPLWYVAWKGPCAAMLVLLQLGPDAKSHDEVGWTCLHAASQKGHADAADLLLRWGADEIAVDEGGVTTPSALMPVIAQADERDRPRLERLTALLEKAPQDRAWRCLRPMPLIYRVRLFW
ncbi:unnamed protein product [Ectocarpus sp. CCAP 1310/34]|nr:unnamed protein product [Ectocarpus sp. CCAP 1310/34]